MIKAILLCLGLVAAGALSGLYFADEYSIREAKIEARHLKSEFDYRIDKAKLKGEKAADGLSQMVHDGKNDLSNKAYDGKEKVRDFAHEGGKFWDEALYQTKKAAGRIERNAGLLLDALKK